ncbi:glycoside hydrolase family 19 protein [Pelagibacterium mangrovi]|uniref:glycoside hydrolase family 19 protein n=1 Tax=Pelagibacterium mangrovi TaxID=3119828 RepID=UPI002FCAD296
MNAAFFDAVRGTVFAQKLTQDQVDGMNALLDAGKRYGLVDAHHMANVLAQVAHETGTYMCPIKETVMPHHKDKSPSDATVISRLDAAFAKGQLPWVKKPYWRDGWFGRGPLQITHRANYDKLGKCIGVDLVKDRDLALDRNIGASIAVVGMRDGLFTGKKLSDYVFPSALDAAPAKNPRRIVNGQDGTDAKVARYHRAFHAALVAAGWGRGVQQPSDPIPAPTDETDAIAVVIVVIILVVVVAVAVFLAAR